MCDSPSDILLRGNGQELQLDDIVIEEVTDDQTAMSRESKGDMRNKCDSLQQKLKGALGQNYMWLLN